MPTFLPSTGQHPAQAEGGQTASRTLSKCIFIIIIAICASAEASWRWPPTKKQEDTVLRPTPGVGDRPLLAYSFIAPG